MNKIAPKIAIIWINIILIIRPVVCSLDDDHSISVTPKYEAINNTVWREKEKIKKAVRNLVNFLLDLKDFLLENPR